MNLLFPAGLALSALAVPLVALYFLRLRRQRVRVSSLLPWHAVLRDEKLASPFHRFRRNLLLLVQLLLLALLVLALARPTVETTAAGYRSVVVVIDTTASMGATDAAPAPHRLAAAVDHARALIDALGPADEVMVVTAGSSTAVAVPFTRDHDDAVRALAALTPTEAEGGLEEAVSLALSLARTRPDVQVVVLSDGGSRPLTSVEAGEASVRFERVGRDDTNAGIVALDLRRSVVSELDQQLFVTVRAFGREAMDGAVEVYLEQRLVGLRNARLAPNEPVSMVFDLPSDGRGVLEVRLSAPGDRLPADDRAVAVLRPADTRQVLLVGGDALLEKILAHDARITASRVAPGAVTPELLGQADAILFAGPVPDGVDGFDYAVLGPFPGGPLKLGGEVTGPRITGWQRTHPALRFTRWDDVTIGTALQVLDPGGLSPIVDAEHGPLVLAGQRNGGRVAALAFDPYRTDLPLRVAWPILVMNLVGWLTEDGRGTGPTGSTRTGQSWVQRLPDADADATPTVSGPGGAGAGTVTDGVLRVVGVDRVGVYEVRAGNTTARFAANLLSEGESDIRPRSDLDLTRSAAVQTAGDALARRELWRPLLVAAVVVLVLEWLLWTFRRSA